MTRLEMTLVLKLAHAAVRRAGPKSEYNYVCQYFKFSCHCPSAAVRPLEINSQEQASGMTFPKCFQRSCRKPNLVNKFPTVGPRSALGR